MIYVYVFLNMNHCGLLTETNNETFLEVSDLSNFGVNKLLHTLIRLASRLWALQQDEINKSL